MEPATNPRSVYIAPPRVEALPRVPVPRYLRIHRDLKRRIESGALAPGAGLPSQRRLSQEYGVTLMTLRHALELLRQDGLIVTQQGIGTRVAPRRVAYSVGTLHSLSQEMAQRGLPVTTRIPASVFEPASPAVARALGLQGGAEVLRLDRLRCIAGQVSVYQHSYLPAAIGRRVLEHDLAVRSLYEVLAVELGLPVVRATEEIHPVLLGREEARLLRARPRAAAMLSVRTTFTRGMRRMLYDEAYLPGDRFMITTLRRSDEVAVRYELRTPVEVE